MSNKSNELATLAELLSGLPVSKVIHEHHGEIYCDLAENDGEEYLEFGLPDGPVFFCINTLKVKRENDVFILTDTDNELAQNFRIRLK